MISRSQEDTSVEQQYRDAELTTPLRMFKMPKQTAHITKFFPFKRKERADIGGHLVAENKKEVSPRTFFLKWWVTHITLENGNTILYKNVTRTCVVAFPRDIPMPVAQDIYKILEKTVKEYETQNCPFELGEPIGVLPVQDFVSKWSSSQSVGTYHIGISPDTPIFEGDTIIYAARPHCVSKELIDIAKKLMREKGLKCITYY